MIEKTGLRSFEVKNKILTFGYNELPQGSSRNPINILVDTLKEPTLILLIIASFIYLLIGDLSDGLFLLASVLVMLGISFYQENKAEKTLQSLRQLSSPRAFVIRDGKEIRIPSRELVPGDVILVYEGDRIPADATLLESKFLRIDESTLTGESVPVSKSPMKDPNLFLGSLVTGGQGIAQVTATGASTHLGKLGLSLKEMSDEKTPLQNKMLDIVKRISVLAMFLCLLIVVAFGINFHDWLQGALSGIAAAISLLPAEYPLVLALFLSMGTWRISQKNVLVRRLPALEALGSITHLCVDKTGTLTQNQMTIRCLDNDLQIYDFKTAGKPPEEFHLLIEYAALASHVDPFDPMDKAIWSTLSALREPEHIHRDWTLVQEYPLSDNLRAMSCVWKSPQDEHYIVAAKGAPESIIDLCHLSPQEAEVELARIQSLAKLGYRILGVAKAQFSNSSLPPIQHDFEFEWMGLLAMEDPIRPEARAAVQECHDAGIQLSMITGDYPETAKNIASQIGLQNPQSVITGEKISLLSKESFSTEIQNTSVFARVLPKQKLDIIEAYQASGHIVAMTGDGVNDAPALRKADVGIAMGARGTDVAREASDLVLLDDNFSSIVQAIRSGRRIYENIRKAFLYLLCIHIPIAGLTILPVLLKLPILLFPAHLVLLEMIIDPTCTLAFEAEPEPENIMKIPPQNASEKLFSLQEVFRSLFLGTIGLLSTFSIYWFALQNDLSLEKARTMSFTSLVFWGLSAILAHRSLELNWKRSFSLRNKILNVVFIITFLMEIVIVQFVPVAHLFRFSSLNLTEWFLCISMGSFTMILSIFLNRAITKASIYVNSRYYDKLNS
jgi:Ca2+-transporting ATPase